MATRIYFPSSGAAPVTPSTWLFTSQIAAPVTFKAVTAKSATALTDVNGATSTTSPILRGIGRWVIGPLAAVQISGTIKGQFRCAENNAGASATLAVAIKIIQPNGADRSTLLSPVASDLATTVPPEMLASTTPASGAANRSFNNTAESASVSLAAQTPTAGDYLVIEVGFRSATSTSRTIYLRYGDTGANDLEENQTSVNDYVPWIEFSQTLSWQAATYNQTGALSGIPGLVAVDRIGLVGSGAASAIPSQTGVQSLSLVAAGVISAVPSLTSQNLVSLKAIGVLSVTPALTGVEEFVLGIITYQEGGTLSAVPSLIGIGVLSFPEGGILSAVPSSVGANLLSLAGLGSLSDIPSLVGVAGLAVNEVGGLSASPNLAGVNLAGFPGGAALAATPSLAAQCLLNLAGLGLLTAVPSLTGVETLVGLQVFNEGGQLSSTPALAAASQLTLLGLGELSAVPSLVSVDLISLKGLGELSAILVLTGAETFGEGVLIYQEGGTLLSVGDLLGSALITLSVSGSLSLVPSLIWTSRVGILLTISFNQPKTIRSGLHPTSIRSNLQGNRLHGNGVLQIK